MKKPDDYLEYFNEDGSKKQCPYTEEDGFFLTENHLEWEAWMDRQADIRYSLMSPEERKLFDQARENMRRKMNS